MRTFKVDLLTVFIEEDRPALGKKAAQMVGDKMRELLGQKQSLNMIFAAAPSQNEFLGLLAQQADIDWSRVNAFHMDEYAGLAADAPQGFGNFLKRGLFDHLSFQSVHYLDGNAENLNRECQRYEKLLADFPTDIVCMGIGENAHIAFNDPPVADFDDPAVVKVVELTEDCRLQQVHDGCFASIQEVPTHALTLTVPTLFKGSYLFCMVPGATKAQAIKNTLLADISELYPSSILRRHAAAALYIDEDSAALLPKTTNN